MLQLGVFGDWVVVVEVVRVAGRVRWNGVVDPLATQPAVGEVTRSRVGIETLALVENAAAHGIAFYVVVVAVYHGVLFFEFFG